MGRLRVSEAVSLKLSDINGDRKTICIEQGKGRRDRYALLSPVMWDLLRAYWYEAVLTIAADPKHLGAKIAITSVLHT